MVPTFHYEGGLHARIPAGPEAACLKAWQAGFALAGDVGIDVGGEFLQGDPLNRIARTADAQRVYGRVTAEEATILLIDPGPSPTVTWQPGWKQTRREAIPGVVLVTARRDSR